MSFVGVITSMCVPSAYAPESLTSFEEIASVHCDQNTFLHASSRNGWLNQCLSELAQTYGLSAFPSKAKPLLNLGAESLSKPITELRALLELFAADPLKIPEYARWQATAEALACVALPAPQSFLEARAAFEEANADGEGQDLPELLALLWCQLRLMEHARDNRLNFVSSELT